MNAHVPQSLQTHEELLQLAAVPTQIISPREAKPIISVVQDIVLGLYRITKPNVQLTEKQFFNLMVTNPKGIRPLPQPIHSSGSIQRWSGRQILSSIIPEKINVDMKSNQYNENKTKEANANHVIKITNGQIKSGTFDKDVYQARTKGLVHSIFNEYGPDETRIFLDNTQKLICNWLVLNGFSVGISDMVVDESSMEGFQKIIHDMKVRVYDVIGKIHMGKYENKSTKSNSLDFEREVNNMLNEAVKKVGDSGAQQVDENVNRLINMIKSKSKGSTINVSQMIGCLGQQNVDGKRIPYGFDYRTLPHYTKYDDGPESRGFVESSFIRGLTPQEFFFHAMGGREGLIDTAVQSVTGDTPIIIMEDGKTRYVNIGDWIDGHLARAKDNNETIQVFPEKHNMEYFKFNANTKVYIPTGDEHGKTSWGEMSAITRHDPSSEIYEVKTLSGRSVKVVDSKSLLIWDKKQKQFVERNTSEVKVGDCLPTMTTLEKPPVIHEYFDMTEYFPKTEYVYGTEFNKAMRVMDEAMQGKYRVPPGWWNKHNGTTFTLPYVKKASLQRAKVRSNTENILDGCFYPYHAGRDASRIPDKFELNEENGIFVGLYLAEGCFHEKSGTVSITNKDPTIQAFVGKWCDKMGVVHRVDRKEVEMGSTESVICSSTLLARFFERFCGHLAPNKRVPDIAYSAPDCFVKGLINGYTSGDGTVGKTGKTVSMSSTSRKLLVGINHLLARFGIFSRFTSYQATENNLGTKNILRTHELTVSGEWADMFADQFNLLKPDKQTRLDALTTKVLRTPTIYDFKVREDVVLDTITSIEKVTGNYPKVYDVTVPSTLHFIIAESYLQMDTSETGYLQRKLVKAMEDCKVYYDGSVRNASGSIIQFLYGDDGMDATKIESQQIPYVEYDHDEFVARYNFSDANYKTDLKHIMTDDAYKTMNQKELPNLKKRMDAHIEQLTEDREFIIVKLFKGKTENSVMCPVSFFRIINIAKGTLHNVMGGQIQSDLSPSYVLDTIEELCKELYVNKAHRGNHLFQMLIRAYLSPKIVIMHHNLNQIAFDYVVNQVRDRYVESLAHPSEMVGIISAQSIGEPSTQLTLNTFHLSGVASASKTVRGVPRLKELLGVSKKMKTPSMKIHFIEKYRHDSKACFNLMNDIRTVRFKDIVVSSKIYFDPKDLLLQDNEFINIKKKLDDCDTAQATLTPWVIRMQFNKESMIQYHIDTIQLHQKLLEYYRDAVSCYFTDDNTNSDVVFRIKMTMGQSDADDMLTELKALEHNILENIIIKGTENIEGVSIAKDEKMTAKNKLISAYNPLTQKFETEDEWCVVTDGTNFIDVLANPNVDSTRTITNNIVEVYETLGIEAVRQSLFNEIGEVLDGVHVDYRHIAMLVDVQTNKGYILSIDRHGINRGDIGPLAKCSFEETTDKLIKAGVFAEVDKINGVSANIMLGQIAPAGTGDCEILMDHEMINYYQQYNKPNMSQDQKENQEYTPCDIDNFKINYHLPKYSPSLNKETPQLLKRIRNI